ncbi:RHS repeat-associated core domain-containing protein [bacterium]|nr:RHS repeat-associated core domain-containing protein [bacterium]
MRSCASNPYVWKTRAGVILSFLLWRPTKGESDELLFLYKKEGEKVWHSISLGEVGFYDYKISPNGQPVALLLGEGENTRTLKVFSLATEGEIRSALIEGEKRRNKEIGYMEGLHELLYKMVQVNLPYGLTIVYAYDYSGKRIAKTAGGTTIDYYFDGDDLIIESQGANILAYYTQGQGLLSQRRNNASYFNHYDGLGSAKALTDANQNIQSTTIYDAWGNILQASGAITNPYLYVGELGYYGDGDAGMYLLTQRWYNPAIGRFVVRDPLNELAHYPYVAGNPFNRRDPEGTGIRDWWRRRKEKAWGKIFKEACEKLCTSYTSEVGVVGWASCKLFCSALWDWAKTIKDLCKWIKKLEREADLCNMAESQYNYDYTNCVILCKNWNRCSNCCHIVSENRGEWVYGRGYELYMQQCENVRGKKATLRYFVGENFWE